MNAEIRFYSAADLPILDPLRSKRVKHAFSQS